MSDDFENINSRIPDLGTALAQRIAAKTGTPTPPPPPGTVDPYKLMLQRKNAAEEVKDIDPSTIVQWPEEDVNKLQDYCKKMGVVGYKTNLNPIVALGLLKKQFGEDYTGVPLEERCPPGYEKRGTPSPYGPNYPYTEAMKKKQILHG